MIKNRKIPHVVKPPPDPPKRKPQSPYLSWALIIILGGLVYANSLQGQFLWDDETLIQYNPYIKDWSRLPQIFTSRLGSVAHEAGAFYRPLQTLTYLVDYSLWRLNVVGYHAVNTVLHILVALSLFGFVQTLFQDRRLSLLTALLFVVHPVHTEAVAYISGRADSLASLFMFLTGIFYLKNHESPRAGMLIAMGGCYVLALLSKEMSLILPALLLLYHYAFNPSKSYDGPSGSAPAKPSKEYLRRGTAGLNMTADDRQGQFSRNPIDKKAFIVLAGIWVGYGLWRFFVIGTAAVAQGAAPTFFQRLPGVFIALTNYYRLLLFPFHLHMEYGGILFSWREPAAVIGVILTGLWLGYVLLRKRRDRFLLFATGWFFIALLPSSNLLYPINAYMAEHWLYLPSIGFFLIAARFLTGLWDSPKFKGMAVWAVVVLVAFYSALTVGQNNYWRDGINFYRQMLRYAPTSSRLYNNLAKAYHDAGKNDELIEILKSAIGLQPDNALAYNNLGNAYKGAGRFQEAADAYQQAIKIDPAHAGPYYNLSIIYSDVEGKKDEAVALLNKSIELSPNFSKAYNKLGIIYLEQGQTDKAAALLDKALRLNPDDPEIYHNLGYIYLQSGQQDKGKAMYQKALEVDAGYVAAYHDLAIIYLSEGDYRRAVEYGDRSAALGYADPALAEALRPHR
jgi:tetratricopeptide (TPR) repeat protein